MKIQIGMRSKDIQKLTGVSKDKLVHWSRIGIIKPIQEAEGRGARRIYSYRNLLEVMVCRELNKLHLETQTIRIVILSMGRDTCPLSSKYSIWEVLEKHPEKLHNNPFLIISLFETMVEIRSYPISLAMPSKNAIIDTLLMHPKAIIINLEKIIQELQPLFK